jgi:hypothetical protein
MSLEQPIAGELTWRETPAFEEAVFPGIAPITGWLKVPMNPRLPNRKIYCALDALGAGHGLSITNFLLQCQIRFSYQGEPVGDPLPVVLANLQGGIYFPPVVISATIPCLAVSQQSGLTFYHDSLSLAWSGSVASLLAASNMAPFYHHIEADLASLDIVAVSTVSLAYGRAFLGIHTSP